MDVKHEQPIAFVASPQASSAAPVVHNDYSPDKPCECPCMCQCCIDKRNNDQPQYMQPLSQPQSHQHQHQQHASQQRHYLYSSPPLSSQQAQQLHQQHVEEQATQRALHQQQQQQLSQAQKQEQDSVRQLQRRQAESVLRLPYPVETSERERIAESLRQQLWHNRQEMRAKQEQQQEQLKRQQLYEQERIRQQQDESMRQLLTRQQVEQSQHRQQQEAARMATERELARQAEQRLQCDAILQKQQEDQLHQQQVQHVQQQLQQIKQQQSQQQELLLKQQQEEQVHQQEQMQKLQAEQQRWQPPRPASASSLPTSLARTEYDRAFSAPPEMRPATAYYVAPSAQQEQQHQQQQYQQQQQQPYQQHHHQSQYRHTASAMRHAPAPLSQFVPPREDIPFDRAPDLSRSVRSPRTSMRREMQRLKEIEEKRASPVAVTRDKPDTWVSAVSGKPPFADFGGVNTLGVPSPSLRGEYLLTHNVGPESPPNRPKTAQIYPSARLRLRRRLQSSSLRSSFSSSAGSSSSSAAAAVVVPVGAAGSGVSVSSSSSAAFPPSSPFGSLSSRQRVRRPSSAQPIGESQRNAIRDRDRQRPRHSVHFTEHNLAATLPARAQSARRPQQRPESASFPPAWYEVHETRTRTAPPPPQDISSPFLSRSHSPTLDSSSSLPQQTTSTTKTLPLPAPPLPPPPPTTTTSMHTTHTMRLQTHGINIGERHYVSPPLHSGTSMDAIRHYPLFLESSSCCAVADPTIELSTDLWEKLLRVYPDPYAAIATTRRSTPFSASRARICKRKPPRSPPVRGDEHFLLATESIEIDHLMRRSATTTKNTDWVSSLRVYEPQQSKERLKRPAVTYIDSTASRQLHKRPAALLSSTRRRVRNEGSPYSKGSDSHEQEEAVADENDDHTAPTIRKPTAISPLILDPAAAHADHKCLYSRQSAPPSLSRACHIDVEADP